MFTDSQVNAVACSRAGYGSGRILPLLDFQQIRVTPKIFLGYSDVTLLLNAFVQHAGFVCFHGPVIAGEFANHFSLRSREHLLKLLMTGRGEECLPFPTTLHEGVAQGRLLGGCLSVLVATLGTPFALDTTNAILFIEDIGEKPYRIDRMLTQLRQAGKLNHLAGVIFGEMAGCLGDTNDPALYPIGFGLPAGHGGENFTLPLGTQVRLDTSRQLLTLLETAVT
jgi:muramoyltetrapeptide carboxypeptidase